MAPCPHTSNQSHPPRRPAVILGVLAATYASVDTAHVADAMGLVRRCWSWVTLVLIPRLQVH